MTQRLVDPRRWRGGWGWRLGILSSTLLLGAGTAACTSGLRFEGMAVEEVFSLGVEKFESEDWDHAVEAFEWVIYAAPNYERGPEARIYLAKAFFNREEYLTAASEFTRFVEDFPRHGLVREAALGTCRSYAELSPIAQRDQTFTERAIEACRTVTERHVGSPEADEAGRIGKEMREKMAEDEFTHGQFYFRRGAYDSARIYFDDLLARYPDTSWAPKALLRLIQLLEKIGYDEEAAQARERLLKDYPDSDAAKEVRASVEPPDSTL